jgi:hypothetical protein
LVRTGSRQIYNSVVVVVGEWAIENGNRIIEWIVIFVKEEI